MKRLKEVSFNAEGGGTFEVFRNGEKLSGVHNREYMAAARIVRLQIADPDAEFHYEQRLKVVCSPTFEEKADDGSYVVVHGAHESESGTFNVEK